MATVQITKHVAQDGSLHDTEIAAKRHGEETAKQKEHWRKIDRANKLMQEPGDFNNLNHPVVKALYNVGLAIEACGSSEAITHAQDVLENARSVVKETLEAYQAETKNLRHSLETANQNWEGLQGCS